MNIPVLSSFELIDDTIVFSITKKPAYYRFIGQNGTELARVKDTILASYVIQPSDTYIRTEVIYPSGLILYLNPVFRFDGQDPWTMEAAEVNVYRTWLLRIVGFSTLIFIILNVYYFKKKFRQKSRNV